MGCISPGPADSDVAGIGILLAFGMQAFIALALASYSRYSKLLDPGRHSIRFEIENGLWLVFRDRSHVELEAIERHEKQRSIIRDILLSGSDTQSITAIALLLSGLIQVKTLSLYHFHIIFDVTSFTSISHCAVFGVLIDARVPNRASRFTLITIFLVLYLAFTICFGIALNEWDDGIAGRCYNTSFIAVPHASHPRHDHIYISLTCVYLYGAFEFAIYPSLLTIISSTSIANRRAGIRKATWEDLERLTALNITIVQFIVHLYFLVAIRVSNQALSEEGGAENKWGFGQILAVAMLSVNIWECVKGGREYYLWGKARKEELAREREEIRQRPRTSRSVEMSSWGL
ncbi:hypothetical protein HYFRA_00005365 [Hymenoscyphus fraxineus]|uniref:Uncharacterized protein n=1 Tax=Hymenoscyphus fraxineus TaxID=746836 RepID=A0A9N9LDQ9_9HELO|nr:hypothetical protein HYFRA_00005365 [Hymenoscyphus fraxineus]